MQIDKLQLLFSDLEALFASAQVTMIGRTSPFDASAGWQSRNYPERSSMYAGYRGSTCNDHQFRWKGISSVQIRRRTSLEAHELSSKHRPMCAQNWQTRIAHNHYLINDTLAESQGRSFSSMALRAFLCFKAVSSFDICACPGASPASLCAAIPIRPRIPAGSSGFSNMPCLR